MLKRNLFLRDFSAKRRKLEGFTGNDRTGIVLLAERLEQTVVLAEIVDELLDDNEGKELEMLLLFDEMDFTLALIHEILRLEYGYHFSTVPAFPRRRLADFNDEEIPTHFRFRDKEDIRRLLRGFRVPDKIASENGSVISGETLLLIGLMRMTSSCTLFQLSELFGFEVAQLSQFLRMFFDFMLFRWGYLLFTHVKFWERYFANSAEAIRSALDRLPEPCHFRPGKFRVCGFIDNTLQEKRHGLTIQTVESVYGMTVHAFGPLLVRRGDLFILKNSKIEELLDVAQRDRALKYCIYGDSTYPCSQYVASRHNLPELTEREQLENRSMSRVRDSIGPSRKELSAQWSTLEEAEPQLKLGPSEVVERIMTALLFRNAHASMYGNQVSRYFRVKPPSFESWVRRGPFLGNVQTSDGNVVIK